MERVFLDANVVLDGLVSRWSASRAVLILCAVRALRLVVAEFVVNEIENVLLVIAQSDRFTEQEINRMIEDYEKFMRIAAPEIITVAESKSLFQPASIIHHVHDVPVLAAALKAQPDCLLSLNQKHFSPEIAQRTGLQIQDPLKYLRSRLIS